jgi:hypothetical protein
MNWRLWTWKDYVGLLLAALLVVGVAVAFVGLPGFLRPNLMGTKAGFGPEWTCSYPGKGDPVCVKKSPEH